MKKEIYLLLLLILGCKFFGLVMFKPLLSQVYSYAGIIGIFLYYGYMRWGKNQMSKYHIEMKYWYWMIVGLCISIIPMIFTVGQNPIYSIWIYRNPILVYCCFPVLLTIGFTKEEVIKSTWWFSLIYMAVFVLVLINPGLKSDNITETNEIKPIVDGDFGYILVGYEFLLFPLYSYLVDYKERGGGIRLVQIIFLIISLFILQNRSVFFPAMIFTTYMCWTSRVRKIRLLLILVIAYVIFMSDVIHLSNLIDETVQDVERDDYARKMSYTFFSSELIEKPWLLISGVGNQSVKLSKLGMFFSTLGENNIYTSDVGFLGYAYMYGCIALISFSSVLFNIIRYRAWFSSDIVFMAIHILVCSFTISYFVDFSHSMWFFLMFLLASITYRNRNQEYAN